MVAITKLAPEKMVNRLDASYYHPEFIKNEEKLYDSKIPISKFGSLISEGRRAIYFQTSTLGEEKAPDSWVPFLIADDLGDDGFFIELNARRRVSPEFASKYSNGLLRENEILVKVKGPN